MTLNRRSFNRLLSAGVATSLIGVKTGGAAGAQPSSPKRGGKLVWGIESQPITLNAQINGQAKARLVVRNLFDSLLSRDEHGAWLPWLAESHEIRDEGRTYIFTLREGVKFHDGLSLDAEAVALNFAKVRDPAYAQNLADGPITHLETATALDARRVKLTLGQPYAHFFAVAANLEILSPAAYDSGELKSGGASIAGTGPFILEESLRGQEVRLRRNPDYAWAPPVAPQQGPAYLEELVYRILPESSVRIGALTSGQVDVIEGVSGNDAEVFANDPAFIYLRGLNTGSPYALYFNVQRDPTRDPRVRRAIRAAVDLDRVIQSIYRGHRTRAWGFNSPVEPQIYDASIEGSYGFDPALAGRLLDEAGWSGRDSEGFRTREGERLRIHVVQSQSTVRDQRDVLLQALQAQARQNAGIELHIEYVDSGTYAERRKTGAYGAIANSNAQIGGLDLEYKYLPIGAGGAHGFSRADAESHPLLSELLHRAAATLDDAERAAIYARLQDHVIREEAVAFPLYVPDDQIAAASDVRNLRFRPYFQQPEGAYGVWLDR